MSKRPRENDENEEDIGDGYRVVHEPRAGSVETGLYHGDQHVGRALSTKIRHEMELDTVGIAPEHQGKGLAKKLITANMRRTMAVHDPSVPAAMLKILVRPIGTPKEHVRRLYLDVAASFGMLPVRDVEGRMLFWKFKPGAFNQLVAGSLERGQENALGEEGQAVRDHWRVMEEHPFSLQPGQSSLFERLQQRPPPQPQPPAAAGSRPPPSGEDYVFHQPPPPRTEEERILAAHDVYATSKGFSTFAAMVKRKLDAGEVHKDERKLARKSMQQAEKNAITFAELERRGSRYTYEEDRDKRGGR